MANTYAKLLLGRASKLKHNSGCSPAPLGLAGARGRDAIALEMMWPFCWYLVLLRFPLFFAFQQTTLMLPVFADSVH
jgi:hypothetical protein